MRTMQRGPGATTDRPSADGRNVPRLDLISLAILAVCLVSLSLGFIAVSKGATPLVLIPGVTGMAISVLILRH